MKRADFLADVYRKQIKEAEEQIAYWQAKAEAVEGDDRRANHLRGNYLARARSYKKAAEAARQRLERLQRNQP